MKVDAPITVTLSSLDMTAAWEADWPFALVALACRAMRACVARAPAWSGVE
jgi:hypothetical protein